MGRFMRPVYRAKKPLGEGAPAYGGRQSTSVQQNGCSLTLYALMRDLLFPYKALSPLFPPDYFAYSSLSTPCSHERRYCHIRRRRPTSSAMAIAAIENLPSFAPVRLPVESLALIPHRACDRKEALCRGSGGAITHCCGRR
jgi:hypothetical protein